MRLAPGLKALPALTARHARALLDRTAAACDLLERVFSSQADFDPALADREFTILVPDYAVTVSVRSSPGRSIMSDHQQNRWF